MPVPLTLEHHWRYVAGACGRCGAQGWCWFAELVLRGRRESTRPLCAACMSRGEPEVVVFEEVDYTAGRRAPTRVMQKTARRRERSLAEAIGGRMQPGSGSGPHAKGDVRRVGDWLGDDKTARNLTTKGFRLTLALIRKVRSWCKRGEKFFIAIGFIDPVTRRTVDEVVVMDRHVWEERISRADDHR